jgi:hypothetical protein
MMKKLLCVLAVVLSVLSHAATANPKAKTSSKQIPYPGPNYSIDQAKIKLGLRVPSKYYVGSPSSANQFVDTIFSAAPVATSPQNYAWCLDVLSYRVAYCPVTRPNLRFVATGTRRNAASTAVSDSDDGMDDLGFALSGASWDGVSKITSSGAFVNYASLAVLNQDGIYISAGLNTPGWYVITGVDQSGSGNWITISYTGAATAADSSIASSTGPWATWLKAQAVEEAATAYATFANAFTDVGNGACSTIVTSNGISARSGYYSFKCTASGVFSATDPRGISLPVLTVGTQWIEEGLTFTVTQGSTAYAVGDTFTVGVGTTYSGRRGCQWQYLWQGTASAAITSTGSQSVNVSTTIGTLSTNNLVGAVVKLDPTDAGGLSDLSEYCVITANTSSAITVAPQFLHPTSIVISQCAFLVNYNNISVASCGPGTAQPVFTRFNTAYTHGNWSTDANTTTVTTGASGATQTVGSTAMMKAGDVLTFGTSMLSGVVSSVTNITTVVLTTALPTSTTTGETVTDAGATAIYQITDAGSIAAVRYQHDYLPADENTVWRKAVSLAEVYSLNAYGTWYQTGGVLYVQPPSGHYPPTNSTLMESLYTSQSDGVVTADCDSVCIKDVDCEGNGMPVTSGTSSYTGYGFISALNEDRQILYWNDTSFYNDRHAGGNLGLVAAGFPGFPNGYQGSTPNGGGILTVVGCTSGLEWEGVDWVLYTAGRGEYARAWNKVPFGVMPGSAAGITPALGKWYANAGTSGPVVAHGPAVQPNANIQTYSSTSVTASATPQTIALVNPGVQSAQSWEGYPSGWLKVDEGANAEWISIPNQTSQTYPNITAVFAKNHTAPYYVGHYGGVIIDIGTQNQAGQYQTSLTTGGSLGAPYFDLADARFFTYNEVFDLRKKAPADAYWQTYTSNGAAGCLGSINQVICNSTYNFGVVDAANTADLSGLFGYSATNALYINCDLNVNWQITVNGTNPLHRYWVSLAPWQWGMKMLNCRLALTSPDYVYQMLNRATSNLGFASGLTLNNTNGGPIEVNTIQVLYEGGDLVSFTGNANATTGAVYAVQTIQSNVTSPNVVSASTTVTVASTAGYTTGDSVYLPVEQVETTATVTDSTHLTLAAAEFTSLGEPVIDESHFYLAGTTSPANTTVVSGGNMFLLMGDGQLLNSIVECKYQVDSGGNMLDSMMSIGNNPAQAPSMMLNDAYFGEPQADKFNVIWGYSNDAFCLDLPTFVPQNYRPRFGDPLIAPGAYVQGLTYTYNGVTHTYYLGYDKSGALRSPVGAPSARGPWEYQQ